MVLYMICLYCSGCCILLMLTKDFFSPQVCIKTPSKCEGYAVLNGAIQSSLNFFVINSSIQGEALL